MDNANHKPDPRDFFERVYKAFQRAEQSAGEVDRYYRIGGYSVRLRFAGSVLIPPLTPALVHLAVPPAPQVDLTICLWDSASTGTVMPPPPFTAGDLMMRGEVRGFSNERFYTMVSKDVGALNMLDVAENLGAYWIREPGHVPTYQRAAPLLPILHRWMRQQGIALAHAGAVGLDGSGVLLIGKSGSGKTSTTLISLLSGWSYVGDDYCLLATNPIPYVHSVYNSAKVDATYLRNFPMLHSAISNPQELGSEKALVFLAQSQPTSVVAQLPVNLIFLPQVTGRPETTVTPISPSTALRALAPSSLLQLPGAGQSELLLLADFVRRVPCYSLELGSDKERIPETMRQVLRQ